MCKIVILVSLYRFGKVQGCARCKKVMACILASSRLHANTPDRYEEMGEVKSFKHTSLEMKDEWQMVDGEYQGS